MRIFWLGLAVLSTSFAQPLSSEETKELLERLSAQRAGRTIQAEFVERKSIPMMRDPVVEEGTIAFEAPDKFFRRTKSGSLAISDGRELWMYYPEFSQAENYRLDKRSGPGELLLALSRIFQLHDMGATFRVTVEQTQNGWRLTLRPRASAIRRFVREARLDLDANLSLRSSLIESPSGDRTETDYSNERIGPAGSVDFRFVPPPGTTVVSPDRS
ncbi:MAG: outer membrane lipoprotein carrier protein LolA [Terrimicrobiaceae bacterium]|nr:outer membrane lipoprotein carrier protein LolA [Terrimicrobiaceae bacterium]